MARDLTYLDFDVLIERADQGAYRVRVVNAPAGPTSSITFTMPFSQLELENFVLKIGRPRRVVRRVDAPETAAIKSFGGQLYRALFRDELEVNLLRSLSQAAANGVGLRLRLRLSDTPELAELPWEYLYDRTRNRFLALSDRTPLVRFLEVPDPPRPLLVSPPLRVLVMIASPSDYLRSTSNRSGRSCASRSARSSRPVTCSWNGWRRPRWPSCGSGCAAPTGTCSTPLATAASIKTPKMEY